jgi:arylamine N-acetyltransferase
MDVAGYLARLGIGERPGVSADELAVLQRAQVERIAYNNLDIQLGQAYPIEPTVAAQRIVDTGRGGYCFQQNGALGLLLETLGYAVRRHRGGVWSTVETFAAAPLRPYPNHMVLTVHALPTPANPGGDWLIDAGLGDALHSPLPLVAGEYRQGPFTFGLAPSPVLSGWRFTHDPSGSFPGMDFELAVSTVDAFEEAHADLSTAPTSSFVQKCTVQRRDGAGADKLLAASLRRFDADGVSHRELTTRSEWRQALADVFGITLSDVDPARIGTLWDRVQAAQEVWKASRP